MNNWQRVHYIYISGLCCLGIVLGFLAQTFIFISTTITLIMSHNTTSGFSGAAITYSIRLGNLLAFFVTTLSNFENMLISFERIKDYFNVENEVINFKFTILNYKKTNYSK